MRFNKLSPIEWTDFSGGALNFVIGCTPVSEGCEHCYARRWGERWGRDFGKVTIYADKLAQLSSAQFLPPFRRSNHRPMAFVVDLGDLFHSDVPDEFIAEALDIFRLRDNVDWQVLTKRPERMLHLWGNAKLPRNVWVGVTAETQRQADMRLPLLAEIPAAVRFVSVEPMLEPVTLPRMDAIHWVICGGESGPERRPFDKAWAWSLREQSHAVGVLFFFKQGSASKPGQDFLLEGQVVRQWPVLG